MICGFIDVSSILTKGKKMSLLLYVKLFSLGICICGIIYCTYLIYLYKCLLYYKTGLIINIYFMHIDIFSLILIYITFILYLICIGAIWDIKYKIIFLYFLLFISIVLLIFLFSVINLLVFYILFELILVPIFLIIVIWCFLICCITVVYRILLYTVYGSFFFSFNYYLFIYLLWDIKYL